MVQRVFVSLQAVAFPRMEICRDLLGLSDHDIFRQDFVYGKADLFGRNGRLRIKDAEIPPRVHARVRTGDPLHADVFAQAFRQRLVQDFLDRKTGRFGLPAAVVRSVIGDGQHDPFHFRPPKR